MKDNYATSENHTTDSGFISLFVAKSVASEAKFNKVNRETKQRNGWINTTGFVCFYK